MVKILRLGLILISIGFVGQFGIPVLMLLPASALALVLVKEIENSLTKWNTRAIIHSDGTITGRGQRRLKER